jgi:hypothetical protein
MASAGGPLGGVGALAEATALTSVVEGDAVTVMVVGTLAAASFGRSEPQPRKAVSVARWAYRMTTSCR